LGKLQKTRKPPFGVTRSGEKKKKNNVSYFLVSGKKIAMWFLFALLFGVTED